MVPRPPGGVSYRDVTIILAILFLYQESCYIYLSRFPLSPYKVICITIAYQEKCNYVLSTSLLLPGDLLHKYKNYLGNTIVYQEI